MVAATQNLFIEQGATFQFDFQWLQGDTLEDATPVDLTGWVGRMQIRRTQRSAVLANATTENDMISFPVPEEGRVRIKLDDETTDLVVSRTAKYDLELENPAGDVFRVLEGSVTVSPNITQEEEDPEVS